MKELAPIVFVFEFDVCNKFFVRSSYFTSLFSKNFHMNDGFSINEYYLLQACRSPHRPVPQKFSLCGQGSTW